MSSLDQGTSQICPYLGISGDPYTYYSFPEGAHRCHAKRSERTIDLAYQSTVCMAGTYASCSRYKGADRPAGREPVVASVAPVGPAFRPSRRRAPLRTLTILAVALIVIVAIALARAIIDGPGGVFAEPSPPPAAIQPEPPPASPSPTPAPTPSPEVTLTPGPTSTPLPTSTVTAPPSPSPTASPAATPIIHVVSRGETLSYLAGLYGVTTRAIIEANELENRNLIWIGQQLIIPPPQE